MNWVLFDYTITCTMILLPLSEISISTCSYQLCKVKENKARKNLTRNKEECLLLPAKSQGHQMTGYRRGTGPDDLPRPLLNYITL